MNFNVAKYFLLVFLFQFALANDNETSSCDSYVSSYNAGEYLNYKIFFNWTALWIKAGEVSFTVKDDTIDKKEVLHLVSEGRTARSYEWFYKVRDRYESYVDKETKEPLRFIRDVNEGGYTIQNEYSFNPENDEVFIEYMKRKGEIKREKEVIGIPGCTQDLLSAIYKARELDYSGLSVGDTIHMDIFMDGKVLNVYFRYLGKEKMSSKLGKVECIKFSPHLIEGDVFQEEDELVVWVTNDEKRVPIFIESDLKFGKIKAYLKEYEGLHEGS